MSLVKPRERAVKDIWKLRITGAVSSEVYNLIKEQLMKTCPGRIDLKETKFLSTIIIDKEDDLRDLLAFGRRPEFMQRSKHENREDILLRELANDGHTKILCSPRKPFTIKMSISKLSVIITCIFWSLKQQWSISTCI